MGNPHRRRFAVALLFLSVGARAAAQAGFDAAPESEKLLQELAHGPLRRAVVVEEAASETPPSETPPSETPPSQTPPSEPAVRLMAAPGRGVTIDAGSAYSLTIRPRIRVRDALTVFPDERNSLQFQSLRIWFLGHVLRRSVQYGIQLGFGRDTMDAPITIPVLDGYVDFVRVRELHIRAGQFFVPFDRLRTMRDSSLQSGDRGIVVQQLELDRDVGLQFSSDDVGGHEGRYAYRVGLFGGDGVNRFDAQQLGFLYAVRLVVRPFGGFDDDVQGDIARLRRPRLAIGAAIVYDQNATRTRATLGPALQLGGFDMIHAAADVVFKWRGLSVIGEALVRGSRDETRAGFDSAGRAVSETPARAYGYVVQAGYSPMRRLDAWLRWEDLRTPWSTDAATEIVARALGHEMAGGINVYFNGHALKLQVDLRHGFGQSFSEGTTVARIQLDATF